MRQATKEHPRRACSPRDRDRHIPNSAPRPPTESPPAKEEEKYDPQQRILGHWYVHMGFKRNAGTIRQLAMPYSWLVQLLELGVGDKVRVLSESFKPGEHLVPADALVRIMDPTLNASERAILDGREIDKL